MKTAHLPTDLEKLLVSTKFAPPRIGSRYIARTHLLDALQRDRHCRLVLVSGSAGFGKTILLAQWRQELLKDGSQVAWLSLNSDEKLFANFCMHVLAAVAQLGVAVQDQIALVSEGLAQVDDTVAAIVNNVAMLEEELYLILDDYHHVEDPWAHRFLQKLLEHSPPNLHIVLASRAVPPLAVAKLRVMGQVSEIECNDLPFNLAETRTFLDANVAGDRLAPDEIGQIHDFTNGWPASLQLVSIMLKNRPETRATLPALAWQSLDLQHYLSEDVVGHLPPEMSAFMEELSICRRFTASLAEAITRHPDAAGLIERIEEENLLIMRAESDSRSPWFRFHPLFAEYLASRLERRGSEATQELHSRASQWFAQRRLVIEAVRHATCAGKLDEAVAIIERTVPGSWKLSYLGPLLHLVDNLSLDAIAAHPRLLFLGSLTMAMAGTPTRAEAWLTRLRESGTSSDRRHAFKIALVEATIALQRDDSGQVLDILERHGIDEGLSSFERYVYMMVLVPALGGAGRFEDAMRIIDLNPIPAAEANDDLAMRAEGCRTVMLLMMGRVAEAETLAAPRYLRSVAEHGRSSTCATLAAAGLADIYYELDRIDDARELLANRQHQLKTSSPHLMTTSALCEARLELLQTSRASALAFLEAQASYYRSLGLDRPLAHIRAEQVRIYLAADEPKRAADLMPELDLLSGRAGADPGFATETRMIAALARARLALHLNDTDNALSVAKEARDLARSIGRGRHEIIIANVEALALDRAGRPDDALALLAEQMRAAADLGLIRSLVDEGGELKALLQRLAEDGRLDKRSQAYLETLIGHFGGQAGAAPESMGTAQSDTLLTPREIDILGLVAAGMSNKRIAIALGITLETVKWNLKNVFLKLGVSSRYDAMIWARRQNLIV
ncbi:MAG: AAA family ATPase [Sphingopyxis sp.]|nr:AAA family ATPase [Sphingopyxis sp.]